MPAWCAGATSTGNAEPQQQVLPPRYSPVRKVFAHMCAMHLCVSPPPGTPGTSWCWLMVVCSQTYRLFHGISSCFLLLPPTHPHHMLSLGGTGAAGTVLPAAQPAKCGCGRTPHSCNHPGRPLVHRVCLAAAEGPDPGSTTPGSSGDSSGSSGSGSSGSGSSGKVTQGMLFSEPDPVQRQTCCQAVLGVADAQCSGA